MALFRKRKKVEEEKRGPIADCVDDLTTLLGLAERVLSEYPDEGDLKVLKGYLGYDKRSHVEESMRGALYYAVYFSNATDEELDFEDAEKEVRELTIECPGCLFKKLETPKHTPSEYWTDLERMHFVSKKIYEMNKCLEAPPEIETTVQKEHLQKMAEYCQADAVQKNARESFLMAHVPWYDYERLHSDSAFGALCTLANNSVNELVEQGGVELHSVIENENPVFYPIAAISVFLEYVRCQMGNRHVIFFAKDFYSDARKKGDFLLDGGSIFIFMDPKRIVGPFAGVLAAFDYWRQFVCNVTLENA